MKSPLNRGGLRFYLVVIALLCGTVLLNTTSRWSILAGLPCLILGVWLHAWAKGCLLQNRVVAMIGPYRFVRHPFYLANALIDAGLVVMAGWWPLAVALPLWWLAIYVPVIRGEQRFLTESFPDEYPAYMRQVPCLIPWRRPLLPPTSRPDDGFRWSNPNISGGEELPRAARLLAYPLLFFVVQGLRRGGLPWLADGWNLAGLAGLIMVYVVAWELHRHQRRKSWILPAAMRGPMLRVIASAAVFGVVCYVPGPRTCFKNLLPFGGVVVMLLSALVYSRRPMRAVLAEALALLGVVAAGELLWLAPAVIVIYTAWMFDWRLASAKASGGQIGAAYWPWFYPLLALAGAAVIGVKLVGHLLPYHLAMF